MNTFARKSLIKLIAATTFEFFLLCIGPILIGCASFALIGLIAVIVLIPFNAMIIALTSLNGQQRTTTNRSTRPQPQAQEKEEDLTIEDSQGDGLMSKGDIMFPEDNED